ncbi:MAG: hypothetical protein LBH38_02730 [Holosporales bacterium]|jgi:hypothetical protein|nr:hypothetical protein [Holosporales bacterium]
MLRLSAFDLEKSIIRALDQNEELKRKVPIMRIGHPLWTTEEPHLWVEISKTQVVGLNRVHAEGEMALSIPLMKCGDTEKILEQIRNVLQESIPLTQGVHTIGEACIHEKSVRKDVKRDIYLVTLIFDALLKLQKIFTSEEENSF